MELSLTSDVASALSEAARRQGTSPELLALDCLRERFVRTGTPKTTAPVLGTLADLLGDSLGAVASGKLVAGGAQMSKSCGADFAKGMKQKRKQGRL